MRSLSLLTVATAACVNVCVSGALNAQEAVSSRTVPAGTVVNFTTVDAVSSRRAKPGEKFAIRLTDPIIVNGQTAVPAGALGVGEVVHAERSRTGGKPGELILASRYIEMSGVRLPLRSFRAGSAGKDNSTAALAVSFALGPLALFVTGGEIEIPAGTAAHALVATDTAIALPAPIVPPAAPAAAPQETAP